MNELESVLGSDISETLLIPLYVRALESQRPDAVVRDEQAVALVRRINYDFSRVKLNAIDRTSIILRMREFDRYARDFFKRNPEAVVVHIGCGLDTRFPRVDNGRVEWYDLDLPDVIALRRKLLGGEGPRYHLLSGSVFDRGWVEPVQRHRPRPFLFLAEGVLPYCQEEQVRGLVGMLLECFPGAELVCDAMSPFQVRANNSQLAFTRLRARLHWALKDGKDLEQWGAGIRLLDEWFYLDHPEPRLASIQWMGRIRFLARATGVFHYRLGTRPN